MRKIATSLIIAALAVAGGGASSSAATGTMEPGGAFMSQGLFISR